MGWEGTDYYTGGALMHTCITCCSVLCGCRVTTAHTVSHVAPGTAMEQGVSLAAALNEGMPMGAPRKEGERSIEGTAEQRSAEYYDDVYFSSSSSMGEEGVGAAGEDESRVGGRKKKKKKKAKHRVLTNDELFYDPDMDEDDQKWVNRQRMAYHNGEWPCQNT